MNHTVQTASMSDAHTTLTLLTLYPDEVDTLKGILLGVMPKLGDEAKNLLTKLEGAMVALSSPTTRVDTAPVWLYNVPAINATGTTTWTDASLAPNRAARRKNKKKGYGRLR